MMENQEKTYPFVIEVKADTLFVFLLTSGWTMSRFYESILRFSDLTSLYPIKILASAPDDLYKEATRRTTIDVRYIKPAEERARQICQVLFRWVSGIQFEKFIPDGPPPELILEEGGHVPERPGEKTYPFVIEVKADVSFIFPLPSGWTMSRFYENILRFSETTSLLPVVIIAFAPDDLYKEATRRTTIDVRYIKPAEERARQICQVLFRWVSGIQFEKFIPDGPPSELVLEEGGPIPTSPRKTVSELVGERMEEIAERLYGEAKGKKFDSGKLRLDLLPFDALEEVAKVLMYGAEKYGAHNWREVDNAKERYTSALLRHLSAIMQGEEVDPESGLKHIAHLACNALFLVSFDRKESE